MRIIHLSVLISCFVILAACGNPDPRFIKTYEYKEGDTSIYISGGSYDSLLKLRFSGIPDFDNIFLKIPSDNSISAVITDTSFGINYDKVPADTSYWYNYQFIVPNSDSVFERNKKVEVIFKKRGREVFRRFGDLKTDTFTSGFPGIRWH